MLKKHQRLEIRRLLQKGFSQRTIARRIGVSRSAVKAVLGKILREKSEDGKYSKNQEIVHPAGKPKRCPHCGRRVMMPCLACQLLEIRSQKFGRP